MASYEKGDRVVCVNNSQAETILRLGGTYVCQDLLDHGAHWPCNACRSTRSLEVIVCGYPAPANACFCECTFVKAPPLDLEAWAKTADGFHEPCRPRELETA